MTTLFVNGSPNKNGNTARLAKEALGDIPYDEIDLVDYKIYTYGQRFEDDQFDEVLDAMLAADTIIIGSPVYWHNLSGSVRVFLDRLYETIDHRQLAGKRLALLFQGAAPAPWMIEAGEYSIKKFCELYGLEYVGMATDTSEAEWLRSVLR